jgi:RNA polymerase sigma factor (sigma-70 family)
VPIDPANSASRDAVSILRSLQPRLDSLYSESLAEKWTLTPTEFRASVERSVARRFADGPATAASVQEYLETLHIEDLVLASACMQGAEAAWEYLVHTYRPYLRASAGVITKNSRSGTDARELADSLFAELYGLVDGRRGESSLFRYFHGRSSLKTWLRTILAQRHVDRLRQTRRWEPLEREDGSESPVLSQKTETPSLDPHRGLYLQRFLFALTVCLASMDAQDRKRLELYYARGKTLAEVGRILGEHESSVSRNLERARKELRHKVEEQLRSGVSADTQSPGVAVMSDAEIALCFQYAAEDTPIDFRQLFPEKPSPKREVGRKESS